MNIKNSNLKLPFHLPSFFTPLIDIIGSYRGDVIKFSGDALTIYFPAIEDPDLDDNVPPCGTYGCEGHKPLELAVLREGKFEGIRVQNYAVLAVCQCQS
jgi:hypothetical protein